MGKDKAVKFDQGKKMYSTIPLKALQGVTDAFTYGANKYGKYNYSNGMEYSRYVDACMRHLNAWLLGENIDESGNTHLSHAIASLMMLEENQLSETGTDDRNYGKKRKDKF